jgi:hypothetical protein
LTGTLRHEHTEAMRRGILMLASWSLLVLTGSFAAVGAEPDGAARPGEIIIKRTGVRRVVHTAPAAPVARSDAPAESSYDRPGPRNVAIGYLVREPLETGWGAQVYEPAYPTFPTYGCGYDYGYGYGSSCLPSYRSSCYTPSLFRSSSYCGSSFGYGSGYRSGYASRSYGSSSYSSPGTGRTFSLSRH